MTTTTTLKAVLKSAVDRLAGARSAAQELGQAAAGIRAERERLDEERARLANALPPREEIERAIRDQVAGAAARWRAEHGLAICRAAAGRLDLGPDWTIRGVVSGDVRAAVTTIDFDTLAALAGEGLVSGLLAAAASASYEPGPALASRAKAIGDLDGRIAAVEAEHAELVDEAGRAGITLDHMPGERARRIQAEQKREQARRHNAANRDAITRGAVAAMPG